MTTTHTPADHLLRSAVAELVEAALTNADPFLDSNDPQFIGIWQGAGGDLFQLPPSSLADAAEYAEALMLGSDEVCPPDGDLGAAVFVGADGTVYNSNGAVLESY